MGSGRTRLLSVALAAATGIAGVTALHRIPRALLAMPVGAAEGTATAEPAIPVVVTSPSGAPLPRASIRVYADPPVDTRSWTMGGGYYPSTRPEFPYIETTTDASGGARLLDLPPGRWRVVVDSPGCARWEERIQPVRGQAPRPLALRLAPGFPLEVMVRDSRGRPAPEIEVLLSLPGDRYGPAHSTATWKGLSDGAGRCRFADLPAGFVEVWVRSPGAGPCFGDVVLLPQVPRVDAVVTAGGLVHGRIVDDRGKGVPGAEVLLLSDVSRHFGSPTGRGSTDAEGRFAIHLQHPRSGCGRMDVSAPGRATLRTPVDGGSPGEGESDHLGEFRLSPEARVSGRVLGPEGPVEGAHVTVHVSGPDHFGGMEEHRVVTDAGGRFTVGQLPAGTAVLGIRARGLAQEGSDRGGGLPLTFGPNSRELEKVPAAARLELRAGETVHRDVRLVPWEGARIERRTFRGVVVHTDGSPAAGAEVWASGARWMWATSPVGGTFTAADGTYSFEAEGHPDHFALHATLPGYRTAEPDHLHGDRPAGDGRLILLQAPAIRGTVRSKWSLPVAGALVWGGSRHYHKFGESTQWDEQPPVRVREDGTFLLPLAPAETMASSSDSQSKERIVCVMAPGHAPAFSREILWEETWRWPSVNLVLDRGEAIEGRVVDDRDRALPGVAISLGRPGIGINTGTWPPTFPPMPWSAIVAITDGEGRFRVENLLSAEFQVEASLHGRPPERLEVRSPTKDLRIRLSPPEEVPELGSEGPR